MNTQNPSYPAFAPIGSSVHYLQDGEPGRASPLPTPEDPPMVYIRALAKKDYQSLEGCYIVVLFGETGTGKSNFIETLSSYNRGEATITGIAQGKRRARTNAVQAYRMDHTDLNIWTKRPVILVDTPGVLAPRTSGLYVLKQIKSWMRDNKVKNVDFLFYMDRITDDQPPNSKADVWEVFEAMCGKEAAGGTLVVTTMWDLMWNERLRNHATHRFNLSKGNHWKDFLDRGSKIGKFDNTPESAVQVLRAFGPQQKTVVRPGFAFEMNFTMIEMKTKHKDLRELFGRYEYLDDSLQAVQQDIEHSKWVENPELDSLLRRQKEEIIVELKLVSDDLQDYSPEYRKFRDDVYMQLDGGSTDSFSTTGSGPKVPFKYRLEGSLLKLKEFASGKSPKPKAPTTYAPPITLPSIHEVPPSGQQGSSSSKSHF